MIVDSSSYRLGFEDALTWLLDVFNLDQEDEEEVVRVLEGGYCEGFRAGG